MEYHAFLIVRADGGMRIINRSPKDRLAFNEVAFPLTVSFPDTWGHLFEDARIELNLPEVSRPEVKTGKAELPSKQQAHLSALAEVKKDRG